MFHVSASERATRAVFLTAKVFMIIDVFCKFHVLESCCMFLKTPGSGEKSEILHFCEKKRAFGVTAALKQRGNRWSVLYEVRSRREYE